jgi:hypothetical protein
LKGEDRALWDLHHSAGGEELHYLNSQPATLPAASLPKSIEAAGRFAFGGPTHTMKGL